MASWRVAIVWMVAVGCSSGIDIGAPVDGPDAGSTSDTPSMPESGGDLGPETATDDGPVASMPTSPDASADATEAVTDEPAAETSTDGEVSLGLIPREEEPFLTDRDGSTDPPPPEPDTGPAPSSTDTAPVEPDATPTDVIEPVPDAGGVNEPPAPAATCDGCIEDNELTPALTGLAPGPDGCDEYPQAEIAKFLATSKLRTDSNIFYVHLQELGVDITPALHRVELANGSEPPAWMTVNLARINVVGVVVDESAAPPALGKADVLVTQNSDGCPVARAIIEIHLVE